MDEERIIELEIKTAYQDDLLQTLNAVVTRQQQQIDRLEATCRLLNEKITSLSSEADRIETAQEVPPHY